MSSQPRQYQGSDRSVHAHSEAKLRAKESVSRSMAEALKAAVDESGKPTKDIAYEIEVREGYLNEALNPNRDDTQFQARMLVRFMHATGSVAPLNYLCREMHGVFVPDPPLASDTERTDLTVATAIMRECAETQSAFCDATDDRIVTREELVRFEREADDAIRAIEVSRRHLRLRSGADAR